MAYYAKVAKEKEVLALFTAVMRGEITSTVVKKDEVIQVPPTIAERMHAAEQLCKRYGMADKSALPAGSPADMDALLRQLEGIA